MEAAVQQGVAPAAPTGSFEFEGVVRFTKTGLGYLVFTFVVGFAALNTGNNSLYIALSFMLGALILSGLASKSGLKAMGAQIVTVGEAWAGRPSYGALLVTNRSRIWNVRDLVITSPEIASPVFLALVQRSSTIEVGSRFLFQRRGLVQLKHIDVYTRYPFGLFVKKRRLRVSGEAIVFPRLLDTSSDQNRFTEVVGEMTTMNRVGHGTELFAFRDYSPGDSMRHIHWKKSAALGRWIIKQPELEAKRSIRVLVDGVKPSWASDEDFEEMISSAATFVRDALARELDIVLRLPKTTVRGRGAGARVAMFEALALLEPVSHDQAPIVEPGMIVFSLRNRQDEPKSSGA